jgi:hypothetical protein
MTESSRLRGRQGGGEAPPVTQHRLTVLDPFVQGQELVGEVADRLRGPLPARQRDLLGWAAPTALAATSAAPRTLRRSSQVVRRRTPDPAQGGRGLVLGQHDDRALRCRVVEGSLQRRADAHAQVPEPVDQPDAVGGQVAGSWSAPGAGRRAPAGTAWHAVADDGDRVRDIAEVIGRRLGLPVQQVPAETFGPIGPIFATDQPSASTHTRQALGWEPKQPSLLTDLENLQP